ncbi:LisH domain-containing protein ARMC9 [Toxocara canis]|uniref:LisH domain-containing protein ARMC9 n=1 Tax=Toxocara canis TaxID=6265 RepID=A0A0B2VVP3_TOXCA|nr:LisH domain-containing protein ARMC9 [Toxocara canis]
MAGKLVLDAEIAQAIHQYLVLTGLSSAANAFQNDCESRKVKLKKSSSTTSKNKLEEYSTRKKKLLSHFEKGEAVQFLAIWNQLFPANDDRSEAVDVLEFYIRIYFATFPLRKSPAAKSEYREKIADLKSYLEEGAGSKLSDTPELVQYFALPYVNEPGKHPVFKELVQKKWAKGILEKLERQLSRQVLNDGEAKLIKWMAAYYQYAQQTQDSFISPALDASAAHCSDRSALEYRELQDDYYKLIDIAAELIDCLERSYQGKTISADYFADISSRLMESSVEAERRMQKSAAGSAKTRMKRNRSLKGRVDSKKKDSPIKKSESTGTLIPADPNARPSAKVEEDAAVDLVAQLNYTKIANQLIKNTTSRISTLLLHALRQQITRVGKAAAVRSVEMFAQKDVLMLKHRRNSVVAAIVNQGDAGNNVKEELGRFLNALASFRIGRDYLLSFSQGKELLTLLSAALKSKKLHHHAGDHSLAALQKLSLRSSVQKELISQGMLEWLAYVLDSKINAFALEYGCALLMNLCLNPVSNSTLGRVSIPLLNTISSLLRNDNKEICKYVNGVLYSVMCVGRVRARAKEIDLETQIKTKLDSAHCDDDIMQLPVVLKLFNSASEQENLVLSSLTSKLFFSRPSCSQLDSISLFMPLQIKLDLSRVHGILLTEINRWTVRRNSCPPSKPENATGKGHRAARLIFTRSEIIYEHYRPLERRRNNFAHIYSLNHD